MFGQNLQFLRKMHQGMNFSSFWSVFMEETLRTAHCLSGSEFALFSFFQENRLRNAKRNDPAFEEIYDYLLLLGHPISFSIFNILFIFINSSGK
jgi:hypothetical protein